MKHYDVKVIVIDAGDIEESRQMRELVDESVQFISSLSLQRRIGVTAIPFGVVVDHGGVVIAKGVVNDLDDVEELLEHSAASPTSLAAQV